MNKKFGAVIVAAGNSTRMGAPGSKVLRKLCGKPVLSYSLEVLCGIPYISQIAVVCRKEDMEEVSGLTSGFDTPIFTVPGGGQRQGSVTAGVKAVSDCDMLLIHDGARPLIDRELVCRVCEDAVRYGAAAAAVRSKDTCKLSDNEGFVKDTPPRENLFAVQTPQVFEKELYMSALKYAEDTGNTYTDDCQLVEAIGKKVYLSVGDYKNLKITTPEDLLSARAFLGGNTVRVGSGYDVHRLEEGRKLILGGVDIPFEKGLMGHSDADVLCHAVSDALLGAAALGDIGKLFPDSDPRYKNADSIELLKTVCGHVRNAGFEIGNIDATLIAQRPKLAPYREEMIKNIAAACGIPEGSVSVKATTEEGLGFTGEGKGISASAVCTLY